MNVQLTSLINPRYCHTTFVPRCHTHTAYTFFSTHPDLAYQNKQFIHMNTKTHVKKSGEVNLNLNTRPAVAPGDLKMCRSTNVRQNKKLMTSNPRHIAYFCITRKIVNYSSYDVISIIRVLNSHNLRYGLSSKSVG